MIALGIRYLTKYAVATDLAKQKAEWPPHPGRVFMAMAAAYFESGASDEERRALEWLEALAAPAMLASEASERTAVGAFVPANDAHGGIVKRPRQDRVFRRVRPHSDQVFLIWDEDPAAQVRTALASVCKKVTRIGHSSSAVQMWVVAPGEEPEPNLAAASMSGEYQLRVATAGTLRYLQQTFNGEAIVAYDALQEAIGQAKGKDRARLRQEMETRFGNQRPTSRRPQLTNWESYGKADVTHAEAEWPSPFDPQFLILGKLDGPVLGQEQTLQLAAGLRNAAMAAKSTGIPEWLSGHAEDGGPSRKDHAAFFALPYVGGPYGDGHVLGVAMALPRNVDAGELREVLGPLLFDSDTGEEREIRIWNPEQTWDWELRRETRPSPPTALRRETWTAASTRWASVTPVVLHHFPKRNRDGDVERILAEAFVNGGYPAPIALEFGAVPQWRGAEPAQQMPTFGEGDKRGCRYQTHVSVTFPVPVAGPVLVGRGRYRGYGLFRPVRGQG